MKPAAKAQHLNPAPCPSLVTNEYLNKIFPLANCPRGSLDECPESPWYIQDLSSRFRAARFIEDAQTMQQLQARLAIHRVSLQFLRHVPI